MANISHELRTPLNGILGHLELLMNSGLRSDQEECVRVIGGSAQSLVSLVNDLLDIERLESGKLQLELVPFDPADVIERVVDILSVQVSQKKLELAFFLSDNIPVKVHKKKFGMFMEFLLMMLGIFCELANGLFRWSEIHVAYNRFFSIWSPTR